MSDLDIWEGIEKARSTRERHQGNQARRAVTLHTYRTTGWGEFVEPTVVPFSTTYLEKPNMVKGFELADEDADGNIINQDLTIGRFPRCDAFVYKWRRDDNGNYTGAWMGFTVDTVGIMAYIPGADYIINDPGYVIDHHLHFTGIAVKSLGRSVMEQL